VTHLTPFPVVIRHTTKEFYFHWLTNLKILGIKAKTSVGEKRPQHNQKSLILTSK